MKIQKINLYKFLFIIFLVSLLFKPIWIFNNQDLGKPGNDDLSHWLHAATLVYDFDLNYEQDYKIKTEVFHQLTNVPPHPPGAGYLSSPFVKFFSLFDRTEATRMNPVGSYAYLGFFAASLFYFLAGLYLLSRIFIKKRYKYQSLIFFAILTGTLTHYLTTRFLMSHAVEFFLCCALCFKFENNYNKFEQKDLSIIFIIYFLLSITRPSTFIYSLCLLVVYMEKDKFLVKNFFKLSCNFLVLFLLHFLVSKKLYNTFSIFGNYSETLNDQSFEFSFDIFVNNLPKLFNLFFSPSLGIIWTIPVVFFGLLSLLVYRGNKNNVISSSFLFLYIFGALIVLIMWEGRDVAFGQRLLIGLIPFCSLQISKLLDLKYFRNVFTVFTGISYIGYLYFYTSGNLTLKRGLTLWGREVGYTGEDYFIYLFQEIFFIDNIVSLLGRTIYSVNFFKFVNFNNLASSLNLYERFPVEKLDSLNELSIIYYNTPANYLLLVNLLIAVFCFVFVVIMNQGKVSN